MRGALKGFLLYGLILLAIAAVGLVILVVPEPPQIDESILDTVTLENGRFALDGLTAEMSEADVAASLDARNLVYTSSQDADVVWVQNMQDTWLSLADATRIRELGKVTMRRSYYFENDRLTSIELEGKPTKKQSADTIEGFEVLRETLDQAFFPHSRKLGDSVTAVSGVTYEWQGEDGSLLLLSGSADAAGKLSILIRIMV